MSWNETFVSILTLLYLITAIAGVYVLAPFLILGRQRDIRLHERFWYSLLFGAAYWIALVEIMAPLRMHDVPGLMAGSLLLIAAFLVITGRLSLQNAWERSFHGFINSFLDYFEESTYLRSRYDKLGAERFLSLSYWKAACGGWDYPRIIVWTVFLYAAFLRVHDSLVHYSFGFSDPYVHIVWLKELNRGELFTDGVYPRGFHAFLSALGTFCGLEPATLIRFTGGVIGSLIPPSIYFLLRQCRLPWSGALVGTALVSICKPFEWVFRRQTASLSQEFALVFAFAALAFGVRYLQSGHARDRWAFFCGSFVAWSAHTFVGVALLLWVFLLGVDYLARNEKSRQWLKLLARDAGLSAVAGCILLIVGPLLGYAFHAPSMSYFQNTQLGVGQFDLNTSLSPVTDWNTFLGQNGGMICAVLSLFAVPMALFGFLRRKEAFPSPAFLSLISLSLFACVVLRMVVGVGIPMIPPDRAQLFLCLSVAGVAGYLYSRVLEPLLGRWLLNGPVRAGVVSLTLGCLLAVWYAAPPEPEHPQYDDAARLYYQLSSQLPHGSWTVVGQSEDYDLALDEAFSMSATRFLSEYPAYARNSWFPTPYIFIVIEKKPKELPENYQAQRQQRAAEEGMLQDWIRVYSATHHDLKLFKETENLSVYLLYHPEAEKDKAPGVLPS